MADDQFDHFFIAPSNFLNAQAFYRDCLGWRVIAAWGGDGEPRGIVLSGGGVRLVLAEQHATEEGARHAAAAGGAQAGAGAGQDPECQ